jgi:hypothetical protein
MLSAVFTEDFASTSAGSSSDVLGELTADRKRATLKSRFFTFSCLNCPEDNGWHPGNQASRRQVNIQSFARLGKPKELQTKKISAKKKKARFFRHCLIFSSNCKGSAQTGSLTSERPCKVLCSCNMKVSNAFSAPLKHHFFFRELLTGNVNIDVERIVVLVFNSNPTSRATNKSANMLTIIYRKNQNTFDCNRSD